MTDLNNYLLLIDTSKAHGELEDVEAARKNLEEKIKKTTKSADEKLGKTWMKAVSVMQGSWHAIEGIMKAVGVTIPTLLRTSIGSAFAAAKILIPIFTAMEMTPWTAIQGAFGLAQISLGIGAAVAAQREQAEIASEMSDAQSILGGVSSFIGVWSF